MSTFDDTTRAEVDELATCLESAGYTDDAARIRAALAEIDRMRAERLTARLDIAKELTALRAEHERLRVWQDEAVRNCAMRQCELRDRRIRDLEEELVELRAEHEALKAREAALRRRVAESPRAWQHRMSGTVFQSRDGLDATLCDPVRIVLWHDDGGALEEASK